MAASTAASTLANLASSRSSSIAGSPLSSSSSSSSSSCARSASKAAFAPLTCKCEKAESVDSVAAPPVAVHRRLALALLAGAAAIGSRTSPAQAVYGESANVFGSAKKDTGFMPVAKDGFKLDIPAKWNPSKEVEYPGTVLRYEDNFDAISNIAVMVTPTSKSSIKDYGSPEEFLNSVSFLLGRQAYAGKTQSEGGFEANAVAAAAVLETSTPVVNGKEYYNISVLTRTADGGEGGKHQVIVGTVNNGKLYLLKAQAGDKRWFKGAKKFIEGAANSFSIA